METNTMASSTLFSVHPERALAKIERCLKSATNAYQLQSTQTFLSLYYRKYGHPLPQREQSLHQQLSQLQQQFLSQ